MTQNQRSRLLKAAPRALSKHGFGGLTVEHVISEASVSRATFYSNFEDKRDCVRVAQANAYESLSGRVFRVCVTQRDWPRKVKAAVHAAVSFATEQPHEARLLTTDAVGGDPLLAAQARAATDHFVNLLRAGRDQCADADGLPDLMEQALVGSLSSILGQRFEHDRRAQSSDIAGDLVSFVLIPYVGPEEAHRIAYDTR